MSEKSAEMQFDRFIAKYAPDIRALAREALAKMRELLPGAVELVYDNYNALVIGFGPTERASDAVFSIALYPRWITLFFLNGVGLPDPHKLLKGSGKQVRQIRLEDAEDLDTPEIQALMQHALKRAGKPFDGSTSGQMVIKSISAKQRPRRPKS
jgi:hypothetical protein